MGAGVHQDVRLRAVSGVGVSERARVGQRQADRAGLAFEALDNGFRSVQDAAALAAICNRLSARDVQAFYRRWEARLPSP